MFNIDGELMSLGLLVWPRRSFLELYQGKLSSLAEVFDSVLILTWPGPRRLQPAPSALAAQTPGRQNYWGEARRQQDDTYTKQETLALILDHVMTVKDKDKALTVVTLGS